jgi:glucose/arabinose dehydrogenase
MALPRWSRPAALAAVVSLLLAVSAAAASAAAGPPPPRAANGHAVQVVGSGVPTPTAFAFAGPTVFAASGPDESGKRAPGGLFTLANGRATKVPGTPPVVFGLAWRARTLYVSAGTKLIAYTGWDGTRFAGSKVVYSGKKGFPGFNGLAFGPNGRLYAGLSLNEKFDHAKDPFPLSQAVVSLRPNGKDLRVVARGLRQPFQLTFPNGSRNPYVSVLSQDRGKVPPDEIVIAKDGQDYGFPTCTWLVRAACKGFAKPAILLPKHASPMGIGSIGRTLYVSLFGGTGRGPEVVTIPTAGGAPTPFLTGFAAPVIGLGIHGHDVYVGDLTGTIYKIGA